MSAAPVNQVGSIQANRLDANLYVMRTRCGDGHIRYTLNLRGSGLVKQDNLGHAGGVRCSEFEECVSFQILGGDAESLQRLHRSLDGVHVGLPSPQTPEDPTPVFIEGPVEIKVDTLRRHGL